uniref:Putative transcription elongation factor SII n=1 Tax=Erythrocytic necrosis virus TaxID=1543320 RepID=A0A4D6QJA8_9VIRU|nr:putative transcription elongation factor SII [Erythrocytic necrosis virus]
MEKRVSFNSSVLLHYIPEEDRRNYHYIDSIRARAQRERLLQSLSDKLNKFDDVVMPGRTYNLKQRVAFIKEAAKQSKLETTSSESDSDEHSTPETMFRTETKYADSKSNVFNETKEPVDSEDEYDKLEESDPETSWDASDDEESDNDSGDDSESDEEVYSDASDSDFEVVFESDPVSL